MQNELVGWDDGKIYFYDTKGKEHCISENKELLDKMIELCGKYYEDRSDAD